MRVHTSVFSWQIYCNKRWHGLSKRPCTASLDVCPWYYSLLWIMKRDKDYWTVFYKKWPVKQCPVLFSSYGLVLWGINLWWRVVQSSNISPLDEHYLTIAKMTDLPSGALASQILVVPEEAFPDGGPAEGVWLWSKNKETRETCSILQENFAKYLTQYMKKKWWFQKADDKKKKCL